jgi:hypothetical protein
LGDERGYWVGRRDVDIYMGDLCRDLELHFTLDDTIGHEDWDLIVGWHSEHDDMDDVIMYKTDKLQPFHHLN